MPAMYAHLKFGHFVRDILPEETKKLTEAHDHLFDLGLHGPDMFFYYRPWLPGRVNRTAHDIHYAKASVFFEQSADIPQSSSPDAKAWLYGFVCHYALDHACHTYIQQKIDTSNIPHMTVEAEFEKYLMLKDNRTLHPAIYTTHLRADTETARVIAPFFPGLSVSEVRKSIASFIRFSNLLMFPPPPLRICAALASRIPVKKRFGGIVTSTELRADCLDSDKMLERLLIAAVQNAASLIEKYSGYLEGRYRSLGEKFNHTFEAEGYENA